MENVLAGPRGKASLEEKLSISKKTTKKVATGKHTKHGNTQAFPPKPATPNIPTKEIASKDHMAKEHLIANSKLKNLGGRSILRLKVKT